MLQFPHCCICDWLQATAIYTTSCTSHICVYVHLVEKKNFFRCCSLDHGRFYGVSGCSSNIFVHFFFFILIVWYFGGDNVESDVRVMSWCNPPHHNVACIRLLSFYRNRIWWFFLFRKFSISYIYYMYCYHIIIIHKVKLSQKTLCEKCWRCHLAFFIKFFSLIFAFMFNTCIVDIMYGGTPLIRLLVICVFIITQWNGLYRLKHGLYIVQEHIHMRVRKRMRSRAKHV